MALEPGTRLGPYEILALLGAGGMGEVYKGRDTRLDRLVALKLLAPHLAANREARERFEREATTVAKLKHAHICLLYDIGKDAGRDYLVFEYLEGETLSQRLAKGPLPLDHVLQYAIEIADALDKAHRAGVTHRDIKPGNIMIVPSSETASKTETKLLDFGLAKLKQAALPADLADLPRYEWPTGAGAPTAQGTVLGTAQYMAPEQVEGKVDELDARTDIFAFGAVVYEMVTGKKAFEGKSAASVAAKILEHDPPPMSALQPVTPPALDRVVKQCLAKEPDDRWQTASDLCRELKWIATGGAQAGMPAPLRIRHTLRERLLTAVAAVAILIAAFALAAPFFRRNQQETVPIRFSIATPTASFISAMSVSPDGQRLAYLGGASGVSEPIWIRSLDSITAQPLPGTELSNYKPFWSPDSRFLGFFADGKLQKVDVQGGTAQTLCEIASFRGGTWNQEGTILFGSELGGLYRVPDTGGAPMSVTTVDTSRGEIAHMGPQFLPDGRHFLYFARSTQPENTGVYAASLDSEETKRVVSSDLPAMYAPPGYLLFMRQDTLLAQPFDAGRLELTGEPSPVAEKVVRDTFFGYGLFSVSETGVLAYRTGTPSKQMVWVDRRGENRVTVGPPGYFDDPEISPDGKQIAIEQNDPLGSWDIWLLELSRGSFSRFTFDPVAVEAYPLWSPNGERIVYQSNRDGGIYNLYQKSSTAGGGEEPLLKTNVKKIPDDWSSDGRFILFGVQDPKTGMDLWSLPLFGDQTPSPFLHTEFHEIHGQFSPDGRWVAYVSNESGRDEVYVRSFPDSTRKSQVSTAGGAEPRWRRDGRELFYLAADQTMTAVPVRAGVTLELGTPVELFQSPTQQRGTFFVDTRQQYDVTPDGQKFLLNTELGGTTTPPITVVLNWAAGLKK